MLPSQTPSGGNGRPKPRTPAERADEFSAVQQRLKQEAAARRKASAAGPAKRHATGLSQQSRPSGRRTP
jgi:hypothetical protein